MYIVQIHVPAHVGQMHSRANTCTCAYLVQTHSCAYYINHVCKHVVPIHARARCADICTYAYLVQTFFCCANHARAHVVRMHARTRARVVQMCAYVTMLMLVAQVKMLGIHTTDYSIGEAFFGNADFMRHDIQATECAEYLNELFPADSSAL